MNTQTELKNNIQELIDVSSKIESNDPFYIDRIGDKKEQEEFKNLSFSISNDDEVTSILTQRCELIIPDCLLPSRSETPRKKKVVKRNDRSKSPQKKKSRSRSRSKPKLTVKPIEKILDKIENNKNYDIEKFLDEYNYFFLRNVFPLITSSNPNKEKIKDIICWFNDQIELIENTLDVEINKFSNHYEDNMEIVKKLLNMYALVFCTYKKLK